VHFILHFPDCAPAAIEATAKACGLASLLTGHDVLPNMVGPHGGHGLQIGWPSPQQPRFHYDADAQDWVPSVLKDEHGKPRYWVGFWKLQPPKENELRRHYTQAGPLVEFGGQRWKLPTPTTIDARAVYADDGSMRWEVVRQFSWVCDEAEQLRTTYLEEFGLRSIVFRSEPSAQINWLLKLLQINYRITPEVAVYLDLWVGKDKILDLFLSTLGLSRVTDG
jgi:hypothetical protein